MRKPSLNDVAWNEQLLKDVRGLVDGFMRKLSVLGDHHMSVPFVLFIENEQTGDVMVAKIGIVNIAHKVGHC